MQAQLITRAWTGCMYNMQSEKSAFQPLFYHSAIECRDEIEEKFEKSRVVLSQLVGNASEREAHDTLQTAAARAPKTHEEICLGFLGTILTEPHSAAKCLRDLTFVSRDSLALVIENLGPITTDKYTKLTDVSRVQLIWIVKELVRSSVAGTDILCWNLLRQVAGGDTSNRNLWLSENMLEIFTENRNWLEKYPIVIGSAIFTYLRILEDHTSPQLANLRQKEVKFVVSLIRDHFGDCCLNTNVGMGRDFLRLLQCVSKIPEIAAIWHDIYENPKSLSPHLTGVNQLLSMRTSRKYLQSRLTPDMEKKIIFLTHQVKFGIHKRYQDWFQRQYLSTPESQSLRADIIRFIVGVVHPPNEILCSDILPRWAVIGWLLTTCTHPAATANAKLALFFDWLVFDPARDNIMNIEPGILVMHHSIKPHLGITATLLDFLIRLIQEYWPKGVEKIKSGVGAALRTILDKKVLPSLEPLLENSKLEPDLRNAVQENIVVLLTRPTTYDNSDKLENCFLHQNNNGGNGVHNNSSSLRVNNQNPTSQDIVNFPPNPLPGSAGSPVVPAIPPSADIKFDLTANSMAFTPSAFDPPQIKILSSDSESPSLLSLAEPEPTFSDEEDDDDIKSDTPIKSLLSASIPMRNSPTLGTSVEEAERSKVFEMVQTLATNLRIPLESMLNSSNSSSNDVSETLQDVIDEVSSQTYDREQMGPVSKCLAYLFKSDLNKLCIEDDDNKISNDYECSPLSEILMFLLKVKRLEKNQKSKNLYRILTDIISAVPCAGYKILVLLFLVGDNQDDLVNGEEKYAKLYQNLATCRNLSLLQALTIDMKCCFELEPAVVGFLCPVIFEWFEDDVLGSVEFLRLFMASLDGFQLQKVVWRVVQGDIVIFDNPCVSSTLAKTLDWDTWEQHCVWTIAKAHHFPIDDYLSIIPSLDYKNHAEALTAILLLLKNEKPAEKILSHCLCRKPNVQDRFVTALLVGWCEDYEENVAEILAAMLVKASGSPVKRKRGTTAGGRGTSSPAGPVTPSVEFVLGHLELLREQVSNSGIFALDSMQAALLQVQSWVTDMQKLKYRELLSLAAAEEASESKESRGSKRVTSVRKMPSSPTSSSGGSGNTGSSGASKSVSLSGNSTGSASNSTSVSRTRSGRARKMNLKDDSEESSEDEDEVIIKQPKKRKKLALDMDSD